MIQKLQENNIDCRPIVTGNFTRNEVMKYFDYEIDHELKNADYVHEKGLLVGNSQVDLTNEIKYLADYKMKKAIFLDRDGVINKEKDYLYKVQEFEFIDGAFEAIKYFVLQGYIVIVITNQSGIGRGYYSETEFQDVTMFMKNAIKKNGGKITEVYHCPHIPEDNCSCRKPNTGMINKAVEMHCIDLKSSWLIGDKESDIEAGWRSGIENTILVRSGHSIDSKQSKAKYILDSIKDSIHVVN